MNVTPDESPFFAQSDGRVAFHPAARTVRHQFHQIDLARRHLGDVAIVLAHVVAHADLVDHTLRILDEPLDVALCTDRAHHLQTVQRKGFERFTRTILVRMRAKRVRRTRLWRRRFEGIALVLILVDEGFKSLDHRERGQGRTLACLDLRDPFMEVTLAAARGEAEDHAERRQRND
jgi:hypothetical protein